MNQISISWNAIGGLNVGEVLLVGVLASLFFRQGVLIISNNMSGGISALKWKIQQISTRAACASREHM